jgi:phosphatidylglycerophosphatase C
VIFDLDGTITRSDTLIPFLLGCFFKHPRIRMGLFLLPIDIISYLMGRMKATQLKEKFLSAFMGGLKVEWVDSWAKGFAAKLVASGCRSNMLTEIRRCQQRGDRLIICSASPWTYVQIIAETLGINEVVSTDVEVQDGSFTGRLVGENCSGEEKLRKLKHYLGNDRYEGTTVAYGDRKSDLPILRWVDEGWLLKADKLIPVRSIFENSQAEG